LLDLLKNILVRYRLIFLAPYVKGVTLRRGEGEAMAVLNLSELETSRRPFISSLLEESGTDVTECYQCGKCSAGCPLSHAMDYQPHQVMRLCQLGAREKVLNSSSIWLCAACMTCSARCPRDLDIASVMEALRRTALREGRRPKEARVSLFHELFLSSLRNYGRIFEVGLMGGYKLRSGDLFSDLELGRQMFMKGRLKLFPHRIREVGEVRQIFERIRDMEGNG